MRDFEFISAEPELWRVDLDGDVVFTEGNILGTEIDLTDVLNLDRREELVNLKGALRVGNVIIEGSYMDAQYDGFTTLSQTITFLGQTFTISSDVGSELDFEMATLHAKVGFGTPNVKVGGIIGLNYLDVRARLESFTPVSLVEEDDVEFPFPVIGATAAVLLPLDGFAAEDSIISLFADAEVTGVAADIDAYTGEFIDASARVGVRVAKFFSGGLGYRVLHVDFEDDDDNEAKVDLSGPFVFGALSF